jgi:lipooligosaccharide transport system ATP-binding protein
LALVDLRERRDARPEELSGGMRRRLLIARALVNRPKLIVMDEPTIGLDPQVRYQFWSLIESLRDTGTTVLMSTHYIEEAERLADRVAIMDKGRVIAEGAPAELVARHAGREVVEIDAAPAETHRLQARLRTAGCSTRRTGRTLVVARAEGCELDGRRRSACLEDVFAILVEDEATADGVRGR